VTIEMRVQWNMHPLFALFTVASTLHVTPYTAPPLYALDGPGTRVLMLTLPADGEATVSEPMDRSELVFYFVDPSPQPTTISAVTVDDDADVATVDDLDDVSPTGLPSPLHATMRSLGRWLLVLLSMVFVAALLGSVGATRRPLPLAAIAVRHPARPVPLVERLLVLACLWSPMLMLLGLLQAEREMLSSVLLCMAATGALSSAVMLASRRRLLQRLRWAVEGRLDGATLDETVRAEVEARKLVPPPGESGPTPWFRADLLVSEPGRAGEPVSHARVSLDGLVVDDEAARTLVKMALGQPADARFTVLGTAGRAPADAHGAQPLDRVAPTQPRIVSTAGSRALLVGGSPAQLARRLRSESILLAGALAGSLSAAFLTLCN
jgi:hypothetical protein